MICKGLILGRAATYLRQAVHASLFDFLHYSDFLRTLGGSAYCADFICQSMAFYRRHSCKPANTPDVTGIHIGSAAQRNLCCRRSYYVHRNASERRVRCIPDPLVSSRALFASVVANQAVTGSSSYQTWLQNDFASAALLSFSTIGIEKVEDELGCSNPEFGGTLVNT